MRAAVVTRFDSPPDPGQWPEPHPDEGEVVVEVMAAALHPRVRSQADGSHYTSTDELPLVPGVDGVGRDPDGAMRYFVLPDTILGSMAERTIIDPRRSVVLPVGADPVRIAAAMNPAMSSWVALRRRIDIEPSGSVLVLGATGSAGRMAVQIARHLGVERVVAAGRDPGRLALLADLGADEVVTLGVDDLGAVAGDVDVVLDYVWGVPTAEAMRSIVTGRSDRSRPLVWVEIGATAGPVAAIPSAALRAARLQIVGSGQGSVPTRDIVDELSDLAEFVMGEELRVEARAVPLGLVGKVWNEPTTDRVVLVPRPLQVRRLRVPGEHGRDRRAGTASSAADPRLALGDGPAAEWSCHGRCTRALRLVAEWVGDPQRHCRRAVHRGRRRACVPGVAGVDGHAAAAVGQVDERVRLMPDVSRC
ncbi:zinc-binding dehydrogenase [Nakamurella sp. YIM 132087]|uniref:Zinc-binding dehydrogenase n=1 Tax=Nakamurella alba TaxID=2665158 RepID=A0A7K1FFC4_9ACTN|nr:zinc-binding alcohol dehydrogenase family protein [Nakamurella alba]MTD12812.1 zinc-binding dehydrogenase [Nakamurella alba]